MSGKELYKQIVKERVNPYVEEYIRQEERNKNIEKIDKLLEGVGVYNPHKGGIQIKREYIEGILTKKELEVYRTELGYVEQSEYSGDYIVFKIIVDLNKKGEVEPLNLDEFLNRFEEETGLYKSVIDTIREDITVVYNKLRDSIEGVIVTKGIETILNKLGKVEDLPKLGSQEYLEAFIKGFTKNREEEFTTNKDVVNQLKEWYIKDVLNSFNREGRYILSLVKGRLDKRTLLVDNREDYFMKLTIDFDSEELGVVKHVNRKLVEEDKLSIHDIVGNPTLNKMNIDMDLDEAFNRVRIIDKVARDMKLK